MATVDPIKIDGLRELQAALKSMDGQTQKQLRVVFNDVAKTVAQGAQRRIPTKSGRARSSVRVLSTQREARVAGGGAKAPYYPWLDFGGKVGKKKSVKRPFTVRGRFIYPTYDANKAGLQTALEKSLVELVTSVGVEVD